MTPPFAVDYAVHSYYSTSAARLVPDTSASSGRGSGRSYLPPLPDAVATTAVFRDLGLAGLPCPVAERLGGELFTLLVHPTATTNDMDDYVKASQGAEGAGSSVRGDSQRKDVEELLVKPWLRTRLGARSNCHLIEQS